MSKKRPTIGLQISTLNNIYSGLILKGVNSALKKLDANLIIYPAESPGHPWMESVFQEAVIYDLITPQNIDALIIPTNVFSHFIEQEEFEKWINKFATMPIVSIGLDINELTDNQSSLLVKNATGLEKLINHLITDHHYTTIAHLSGSMENQDAIERFETYKHCLETHNIPFKEELVYYGHFTYIDGKQCVEEFLDNRKILPQAFVCANDSAAFGVMDELIRRGYKIPQDVAVTGFDNTKESEYYIPALTTVSQPLFELGVKAAITAYNMVTGQEFDKKYHLDTFFVSRESCGCKKINSDNNKTKSYQIQLEKINNQTKFNNLLTSIDSPKLSETHIIELTDEVINILHIGLRTLSELLDITDVKQQLLQHFYDRFQQDVKSGDSLDLWRKYFKNLENLIIKSPISDSDSNFFYMLKDAFQQSLIANFESSSGFTDRTYRLRNFMKMIYGAKSFDEFSELLRYELKQLEVKNFYLTCFDKPISYKEGDRWSLPSSSRLLNAFEYGVANISSKDLPQYNPNQLIPDENYPIKERFSLVVESLFVSGRQLGRILYEWTPKDTDMVTNLMLNSQISAAINNIHMEIEQSRIRTTIDSLLENLKVTNEQLSTQSRTDDLTKLLNRRGFFDKSEIIIQKAINDKMNCKLLFFDLDGLKYINDTFGHNKGDYAITQFAKILSNVFSEDDAIARFGGDEFVVLTKWASLNQINNKKELIKEQINQFNATHLEKWELSTSIGFILVETNQHVNLNEMLDKADGVLYAQKRLKKQMKLNKQDQNKSDT